MKTQLLKTTVLSILISSSALLKAQAWTPIFTPGSATTGTTTLSNTSLDDMSFFDDNKGIVSLGYSFYLTTDGGATWSPEKDVSPYPQFRGVHYSTAQNIFLGGGPSVFKSVDNGTTFTIQATTSPVLTINDIKVVGTLGIAVDASCRAAYSNDAGNTWTVISNTLLCGNLSRLTTIDIIDNNNAVIAGINNNIFKTTNGGAAWSAIITPTVTGSSNNITSVDFISLSEGFVVKGGSVFKTIDGGTTWTKLSGTTSGLVTGKSVCAVDLNTIYVGTAGKIYKSTNGGTTFALDFTNTICTTCEVLNIEKAGSSIFAAIDNGGSHPKVYKRDLNAVGLNEIENKFRFSLSPNPASESLQIIGVDFNETVSVKIMSIDGKLMQEMKTVSSIINVSELNTGMYFIELKNKDGKTGVTKFIKY